MELDELEKLAREAQEWANVPASTAWPAAEQSRIALNEAASPDVILRLVAIARAAEKAALHLEGQLTWLRREAKRMNSAYDHYGWDNAPETIQPNTVAAYRALREALTKEPA